MSYQHTLAGSLDEKRQSKKVSSTRARSTSREAILQPLDLRNKEARSESVGEADKGLVVVHDTSANDLWVLTSKSVRKPMNNGYEYIRGWFPTSTRRVQVLIF